jgi:membrane-bound ClpP family serine protease
MAIGLGVVLIALGAVLVFDAGVNDHALGGVLLAAGILAIVLSLIVNAQRSRRTIVEERR